MSLNATPRANRIHIAFFGKRNVGKSSVINAITGQELAIVSDVLGTTTDPVYKSIELLPIGPCVIIDTAGLDDSGELGELRVKKSLEVLHKTDIIIYITDSNASIDAEDKRIVALLKQKNKPVITVINKADLNEITNDTLEGIRKGLAIAKVMPVSAKTNEGILELKEAIAGSVTTDDDRFMIVGDLVDKGDIVLLVMPIDSSAPKGRLILPQQQTIRDVLEKDAIAVVTKEFDLAETIDKLGQRPRLVVTDSQAFEKVNNDIPKDLPLTSFSILFARLKGDLKEFINGINAISSLKDGDTILVAEACTHHPQPEDIGRIKLPNWLKKHTGKQLSFEFTAGYGYKEDLTKYALIIHCGGCMLNRQDMLHRIDMAKRANVPIVNYGVLIAHMNGILKRTIEPFKELRGLVE